MKNLPCEVLNTQVFVIMMIPYGDVILEEIMYGDKAKLLNTILSLHISHRFILGIDGLSRSGKTTFAESLREMLLQAHKDVCIFHLDDHIVERRKRYNTGCEEWYEYYNLQWDVEYLKENLFTKVREYSEVNLPFYNAELDMQFKKTVFIPHECIVIIEGVFLQRHEWREFFDYLVYLDCPRETRFNREGESIRDNIEKFRNRYWKAEDHYLESVRPLACADMIIKC
jgi:uridine kinase